MDAERAVGFPKASWSRAALIVMCMATLPRPAAPLGDSLAAAAPCCRSRAALLVPAPQRRGWSQRRRQPIEERRCVANWVGSLQLRGGGDAEGGTPSTLHPQPSTLHPQPYTLSPHPQPYTLHPTPSTLHPTPYILNPQASTFNPQPSKPSTLNPRPRHGRGGAGQESGTGSGGAAGEQRRGEAREEASSSSSVRGGG